MIGNVRNAMARVAAIETTFNRPVGAAASARRASTPEAIQHTFDQVMARAVSSGLAPGMQSGKTLGDLFGSGPLQPSYPHSALSGGLDSGAPRGLEGYGNGQIPLAQLTPVPGTNERLWAPAAAAFDQMKRGAAGAGIDLPLIDGYRTYNDQVRLAHELGLYDEGGLAAAPGTSEHGWGRALDLEVDDKAIDWLRANASRYGFSETVPREPWHWEFHPPGQ